MLELLSRPIAAEGEAAPQMFAKFDYLRIETNSEKAGYSKKLQTS